MLGGGITYTYDEKGNLALAEDSLGRQTLFEYDNENQLVLETDPAGGKIYYTYDGMGNQTSIKTPGGFTTKYAYGLLGYVLTETDALGGKTSFEYDALGRQTHVTQPNGGITKTSFDALGNVTKTEDALGQAHTYTYDTMNRLVAETDPMGGTTNYEFDKNAQLIKQTDALGKSSTFSYDKSGNLSVKKDAAGMGAEYTYDGMGNLVTAEDGTGAVFTYAYDGANRLTSRKDNHGNIWLYTYDHMGNVLSIKNPLGNTQSYIYDKENKLVKTGGTIGDFITYEYDANGNIAAKKYSAGQADTQYMYDADGNIVRMRDISGESSFAYDALNRLIKSVNAQGDVVKYEYSNAGDLACIVYPDGRRVAYGYDVLHRLTSVTGKDGAKLEYSYNAKDEVTLEKHADGRKTLTEYDALGRVIKLQNNAEDGSSISEFLYEYNDSGNISKEVATQNGETVTKTYTYTGRGQLASVRENGGAGGGANWQYRYDVSGNRTWEEIITPDGTRTISHEYDKAGQLSSSTDSVYGKTTYSYSASGNLASEIWAGGSKTYEYTQENQLAVTRQNGTVVMAAMYDGFGNRVYQLARTPASEGARVTEEKVWQRIPTGSGNPVPDDNASSVPTASSEPDSGASESQLPEDVPEEETSPTLFWYGFWQGMYRFSAGTNQALAAERGDWLCQNWPDSPAVEAGEENWGEPLPAPAEEDVLEDIDLGDEETEDIIENRPYKWVQKTKTTEIPQSYWLAYVGTWYVHDLTSEYVQVLAEANKSGITDIYTYGLRRLAHEKPDATTGYLYDGKGSVVQNISGGVALGTLKYDPYGQVLSGGDALAVFFGYNGEEHNPETGLQYLRARYYFAETAAFISQDTIGGELSAPLTQNLYLYVLGNPANYADPSGHSAKKAIVGGKGGISSIRPPQKQIGMANPSVGKIAPPKSDDRKIGLPSAKAERTLSEAPWKSHAMNSVDPPQNDRAMRSGDSILGTKLDMDVRSLELYNRQFCSVDAVKATNKKSITLNYAKEIGVPDSQSAPDIIEWLKIVLAFLSKAGAKLDPVAFWIFVGIILVYVVVQAATFLVESVETVDWANAQVEANPLKGKTLVDHSVYAIAKTNGLKVHYVGITKNFYSRQYVHQRKPGAKYPADVYSMIPIATVMTRNEARALEQTLIASFTLDALGNGINSIQANNYYLYESEFLRAYELISGNFDGE